LSYLGTSFANDVPRHIVSWWLQV